MIFKLSFKRHVLVGMSGVIALFFLVSPTRATIWEFQLHSHEDGGAAPPSYGLRLDELLNVSGNHDIFTFDFDHDQTTSMSLFFDDVLNKIGISGTVFGGLNSGNGYATSDVGYWNVFFEYTANVTHGAVDPFGTGTVDITVNSNSPNNMGIIDPLFNLSTGNSASISLVDYTGNHDFSFKFNNTSSVDARRLKDNNSNFYPGYDANTIVGWGWVNHSGNPHVAASDWLFTGNAVPEPSTFLLFGIGLLSILGIGYRRRKKEA